MEQLDKEPVAKNAPRPKRSQSKKPVAQPKGGEPIAVAQAQEVAASAAGDEVKTNSEELTKVAEQQDESVQGAEQNAPETETETETETVQAAPATATEPSYKDSLVIKVKSTSPQRHYEVASRTWIEPHAVTLIQCKSALQKRTTLSNLKQMGGRNNKFEVIHDSV